MSASTTSAASASSSSPSASTSSFFRCSACTSLIQRYTPLTNFLNLVDKKRRDQQQGSILRMKTDEKNPQNVKWNDDDTSGCGGTKKDNSAFRTRQGPCNLCMLPEGVDALELSGVRWGKGFPLISTTSSSSKHEDTNNHIIEEDDHNLCTDKIPVTLLSSSSKTEKTASSTNPSSSSLSSLVELSSGPLMIEGLNRRAEIMIDLKIDEETITKTTTTSGSEEKVIRYGQYHHLATNKDKEYDTSRVVKDDTTIKTSKTLFGSTTGGPIICHANPCPLTFDRFCQLAVSKTYKPMMMHNNIKKEEEEKEKEQKSSSLSTTLPVTSFVRKLAAATVVMCKVPRNNNNSPNQNSTEYDHFVLLTQRQSYMRTFPSFFVVCGGGFDAHIDGTIENAARRELMEEVSLVFETDNIPQSPTEVAEAKKKFIDTVVNNKHTHSRQSSGTLSNATSVTSIGDGTWSWEGIWESAYPTHPDAADIVDANCTVRGHIVFFFSVIFEIPTVEDLPRLKPQSEEVASAKWYRVGPDVDEKVERLSSSLPTTENNNNNDSHEKNNKEFCDFGTVPPISEYFEVMNLDPQRVELTLELEEELYGKNSKKNKEKQEKQEHNQEDKDASPIGNENSKNLGQRMKITAGTEYFIRRCCERMVMQETQQQKKN